MNKKKKDMPEIHKIEDTEEIVEDLNEEAVEETPEEKGTETLKKEIETLKTEVDRLKNEYARAYADTENMQRRLQNEADQAKKYRIQSFALEVLPALDNLERALSQECAKEAEGYRKGVEMIYTQLTKALKDEGVEEIDVLNKPFDANTSQAIMLEKKEGVESGIVTDVLQKGYMLKDRILRAAMVKVSE